MEWYQVVKLPSATIPCFFRLLFIERKRQGLILGKKRFDRVVSETKRLRLLHTKRYESYQLIRMVCVGIVVYQSSSLPFFFFPLQPLLLSIYLSNSPLKQINCLRPPRRNGATTATTENDNQLFCEKILSPYNPLSPKAIPLASKADRRREMA